MTVGLILASVLPPTAEQQYMSYLSDDFVFKADADNGSSEHGCDSDHSVAGDEGRQQ